MVLVHIRIPIFVCQFEYWYDLGSYIENTRLVTSQGFENACWIARIQVYRTRLRECVSRDSTRVLKAESGNFGIKKTRNWYSIYLYSFLCSSVWTLIRPRLIYKIFISNVNILNTLNLKYLMIASYIHSINSSIIKNYLVIRLLSNHGDLRAVLNSLV